MTEKRSSAKIVYKQYLEKQETLATYFRIGFAKWVLGLPIPLSYERWRYLHKLVGDYK